jgi:hypothetical protein
VRATDRDRDRARPEIHQCDKVVAWSPIPAHTQRREQNDRLRVEIYICLSSVSHIAFGCMSC